MRKRPGQQIAVGKILIKEAGMPTTRRSGALAGLCAALKQSLFISICLPVCKSQNIPEWKPLLRILWKHRAKHPAR
jgi:hypothetical protein